MDRFTAGIGWPDTKVMAQHSARERCTQYTLRRQYSQKNEFIIMVLQ
jgi:hypothetical protein